ncbi:MAG: hypothetical protein KC621_16670 [Myxococcales bacterium]|nr:hypothetical protein [Myxococcales bacterium]
MLAALLFLPPPTPDLRVVHARTVTTCEGMRDDLLRPQVVVWPEGYEVARGVTPGICTHDLEVVGSMLDAWRGDPAVADTVHVLIVDDGLPLQGMIAVLDVAGERFGDVALGATNRAMRP